MNVLDEAIRMLNRGTCAPQIAHTLYWDTAETLRFLETYGEIAGKIRYNEQLCNLWVPKGTAAANARRELHDASHAYFSDPDRE